MSGPPNNSSRIAWLSPLPPQRSGIADYSYGLIKALKPYFHIDLYYDNDAPAAEIQNAFDVYPVSAFPKRYKNYEEVIYHLGNHSGFHKDIYKLAWNFPGTVVLHDYDLRAFMHEAFYRQDDEHLYKEALAKGDGENTRPQGLIDRLIPATATSPMSHAVVNRSRKAIVHHRWVKAQLGSSNHIEVIPLFARLNCQPTQKETENFKNKFAIKDSHFVLSCLGFINSNKLPNLQIDVVKRLLDDGYPVQLIFAGEPAPDVKNLESEIQAGDYREDISFTGYLNENDYFSAILVSDILINLRNPSMGEASATLMDALAAAKPAIVSDLNQYREFPDKVCWKLPHDENSAEVLYAYLRAMLSDRNLRAAMSHNASEYVRSVLDLEKIVSQWVQVILR